jgi:hypothetical protein
LINIVIYSVNSVGWIVVSSTSFNFVTL